MAATSPSKPQQAGSRPLVYFEAGANALRVLGAVVFVAGSAIAIVGGIWWPENAAVLAVLLALGVTVGLINITDREIVPYLVGAVSLILISGTQIFTPLNALADGLGERLNLIIRLMAIFTAPAAVVQAIRLCLLLARLGESRRPE